MTEYRSIPDHPGYLAGDDGTIIGRRGKPRKLRMDDGGYLVVTLFTYGERKFCRASRLICAAFHGRPPSDLHEAAHGNGIRTDNTPSNLRWATPAENTEDRFKHGTVLSGENHPRAGLTALQASEIRAVFANREPGRRVKYGVRLELAKKYNVSIHVIKDIAAGRSWEREA